MSPLEQFWWGFGGSMAVEFVTMWKRYDAGHTTLPARYSSFPFWAVRIVLAAIAGGLAVAYGVTQPLLAANVGAAAPLIIKTLSEAPPELAREAGTQGATK